MEVARATYRCPDESEGERLGVVRRILYMKCSVSAHFRVGFKDLKLRCDSELDKDQLRMGDLKTEGGDSELTDRMLMHLMIDGTCT